MKTNRATRVIVGVVSIGIVLFLFMLYFTVKTKSTSLDKFAPYEEWVHSSVTLYPQTVLIAADESSYPDAKYPYVLLDTLHPEWSSFQNQLTSPEVKNPEVIVLPPGTSFEIEKARQYTNGVSGFSTPHLLGTISLADKTYKVHYQWGQRSNERYFDHVAESWYFHQAPWQTEPDTIFYALPEAKFW